MKVGDLVRCPVNLETGEMFDGTWEMAVVSSLHEREPRVGVIYVSQHEHQAVSSAWFTEELELINES